MSPFPVTLADATSSGQVQALPSTLAPAPQICTFEFDSLYEIYIEKKLTYLQGKNGNGIDVEVACL